MAEGFEVRQTLMPQCVIRARRSWARFALTQPLLLFPAPAIAPTNPSMSPERQGAGLRGRRSIDGT